MSSRINRGFVSVVDTDPESARIVEFSLAFAPRSLAWVASEAEGSLDLSGVDEIGSCPQADLNLRDVFAAAVRNGTNWITVRRGWLDSRELLGQALEATGKNATKDITGFALMVGIPASGSVERILTVVDRRDGQPSGLLVLAAVASAQETGARLDVLVLPQAHEELQPPESAGDILQVKRDKDLYDMAIQRAADAGVRANWIMAEPGADAREVVVDTLRQGDYDVFIDDLGAVRLGGRMGRGRRIAKALADSGPGGLARAVLDDTDVSVVVVLDGVRMGVVSPQVATAGLGALLAFGVVGAATTSSAAATTSPADRDAVQSSVELVVDGYTEALDQATNLEAAATVEQARQSAEAAEVHVTEAVGADAVQDEARLDTSAALRADIEADPASDGAVAEAQAGAADRTGKAPADVSPKQIKPDGAAAVSPGSVSVPGDVSQGDVDSAAKARSEAKANLKQAKETFSEERTEAVQAEKAVAAAAEEAEQAKQGLLAAGEAFDQATAAAESITAENQGLFGDRDAVAEAETAEAQALTELADATVAAEQTLENYTDAADTLIKETNQAQKAANQVTKAAAAVETATAKVSAYQTGLAEATANKRVSPVAAGSYTPSASYGQAGGAWSTGYHTGEDYAAPEGTTVMAAAKGTVISVGYDGAYGNRIVIEHESGYRTTYNHLSATNVSVGQSVGAGDKIGAVGNTGNSFGAHLHFEVTKGGDGWGSGSFVDPNAWLRGDIG